jgi:ssDNA-binding Zn-finger/Zn-ribbon topoisomerase 1
MGSQGLAAFIEEKQFCPNCKSHMKLAKNRRGTAYIRCSKKNCEHTEYLTTDLMNWYISCKNVVCPKHDGGEIKGILGKYGPCVRCNRGHFLKPEEI